MIECSDQNIWYLKKRRSSKRGLRVALVIFILIGAILYYKFNVSKHIYNICADYAYSYSTESVNEAVLFSLTTSVKYTDLISIDKNSEGEIILMATDSYKINVINREVAEQTSKILSNKLKKGMPVPIFAFTGIGILSGFGTGVDMKIATVASVTCDFKSKFQSVGINQTLHSVYITVKTQINIDVPMNNNVKTCETDILISETVLVGNVPEIYLNGALFK